MTTVTTTPDDQPRRSCSLTPDERILRGQVAAHESWARTKDRSARTAPARQAQWKRYLNKVDPDGVLPENERHRRAEHLRKADMKRMALKSADRKSTRL